jgi:hypothetical protein
MRLGWRFASGEPAPKNASEMVVVARTCNIEVRVFASAAEEVHHLDQLTVHVHEQLLDSLSRVLSTMDQIVDVGMYQRRNAFDDCHGMAPPVRQYFPRESI